MTDTIKHDMFAKIKNAKEIAAKALGQVDVDIKTLKPQAPAKAAIEAETKTSKNSTSESVEGKPEIKGKVLAKLKLKKVVAAKTEEPTTKSKLVGEEVEVQEAPESELIAEADADPKEVKKVPDECTKAQKAKAIVKSNNEAIIRCLTFANFIYSPLYTNNGIKNSFAIVK